MDWTSYLLTALGTGSLSVAATAWFNRKKSHVEVSDQSVRTALSLEERAYLRYETASSALTEAQRMLDLARVEIRAYQDYIDSVHEVLDRAGIEYPKRDSTPVDPVRADPNQHDAKEKP